MTVAASPSEGPQPVGAVQPSDIVMAVEVARPRSPAARWRWLACWWCIKLAARFYPFRLEFYRQREWWDDGQL